MYMDHKTDRLIHIFVKYLIRPTKFYLLAVRYVINYFILPCNSYAVSRVEKRSIVEPAIEKTIFQNDVTFCSVKKKFWQP